MKRLLFLPLLLVFAIVGLMPAHAADAPTVSVPWGSWVHDLLVYVEGLAVTVASLLVAKFAPPVVRLFITDRMISTAVHSAIAAVDGATAGGKLELPVANAVLAQAVQLIVSAEPKAAKQLGDTLGPLVAAKLSQLGVAPEKAVDIPRVFGTALK